MASPKATQSTLSGARLVAVGSVLRFLVARFVLITTVWCFRPMYNGTRPRRRNTRRCCGRAHQSLEAVVGGVQQS
eukprot:6642974-Pyramimonas_sp.AAC.1